MNKRCLYSKKLLTGLPSGLFLLLAVIFTTSCSEVQDKVKEKVDEIKGTSNDAGSEDEPASIPLADKASCAFSYLSYLGEEATGTEYEIATKIYDLITSNLRHVPALLYNGQVDWEMIWGPAIVFSPVEKDEISVTFVMRQRSQPDNYQVVTRGTNFHSWIDWLEDADVLILNPWNNPTGNDVGSIANGTDINYNFILRSMPLIKDGHGLPGAGSRLAQILGAIARGEGGGNITFCGHSLGGGLAPVLAIYFAQEQGKPSGWDPNRTCKISITTFAGPTPGDKAFSVYLNGNIPPARFHRYSNSNDAVPKGWNLNNYKAIEDMYKGYGVKEMTDLEYAPYEALKIGLEGLSDIGVVYEHSHIEYPFTFPISTGGAGGDTFYEQVEYQHRTSYATHLDVPEVLTILRNNQD